MSRSTAGSQNLGTTEQHAARDQLKPTDVERMRLITKAELRRMVPYTPQHILRLEKRGLFPRRVQIGANRVAWLLSEVEQWIANRVASRNNSTR